MTLRLLTRRTLTSIATAALVCVATALLDEAFLHPDDGCDVEIHCVACSLKASATGVVSATIVLAFELRSTTPPAAPAEPSFAEVVPCAAQSRAPPLA